MGDWDSDFTVVGRASVSFRVVVVIFGCHEILQKCLLQESLSC